VQSAIANARVKADLASESFDERLLMVQAAYVDEGPTLKRFRPRAQGRAYRIRKRTSHITVVVAPHEEIAALDRRPRTPAATEPAPAGRRPAAKASAAATTTTTGGRTAKKASAAEKAAPASPAEEKPAKTTARKTAAKKSSEPKTSEKTTEPKASDSAPKSEKPEKSSRSSGSKERDH